MPLWIVRIAKLFNKYKVTIQKSQKHYIQPDHTIAWGGWDRNKASLLHTTKNKCDMKCAQCSIRFLNFTFSSLKLIMYCIIICPLNPKTVISRVYCIEILYKIICLWFLFLAMLIQIIYWFWIECLRSFSM